MAELWKRIDQDQRHSVELLYRRGAAAEFQHEEGWSFRKARRFDGLTTMIWQIIKAKPTDVLVSLGHYPWFLAIVGILVKGIGLAGSSGVRCIYFGDTNGVQLYEQMRESCVAKAKVRLLRVGLGAFDGSFVLGATNEFGANLLGLEMTHRIPLYTVDYETVGEFEASEGSVRSQPCESADVCLAFIGRLESEKNIMALLKAWTRCEWKDRDVELLIVGSGSLAGDVETYLVSEGLQNVRCTGAVPHSKIGAIYSVVDGLVLPSVDEPWGNVCIEAMGLGIPVLGSHRVGSLVSLLCQRGKRGMVLTGTSVDELEVGLVDFVGRLEDLTREARRQSQYVRRLYSMESCVAKLKDFGEDGRANDNA